MKKALIHTVLLFCLTVSGFTQTPPPIDNFNQFGNPILHKQIDIDRNTSPTILTDPNEGNYPNNPPVNPLTDNERYVFWVHGLNGDIGSWIRAADASQNNVAADFPARKLKSVTLIDYTQSANISGAAQQLGEVIESKREIQLALHEIPRQNFIIAHSQGGIVSRGLLYKDLCLNNTNPDSLGYGGLVTFGSPHQGARILNNKYMFSYMAADLCSSLTAGPALELQDKTIKKILGFEIKLGSVIPVATIVDSVCNTFLTNVVDLIIAAQTPNITKGYEAGATDITNINNCDQINLINMPKVAFFGEEPDTALFFRTAAYFLKSPNEYDYFKANDDFFLKDAFDQNKLKYDAAVAKFQAAYEHYKLLATLSCFPFPDPDFCPLFLSLASKSLKLLNAYKNGQDWFGRVDDQYKTIIGAVQYNKSSQWYCECENVKTGQTSSTPISGPEDCPAKKINNYTVCSPIEIITFTQVKKISDGVVLAESAMNLPYATYPPQKLDNSSHMQMRNNEALRLGLIKLYDGGADKFFKTLTKF